MHLGTPALLEFFRRHRDDDALVLATVIATAGSTYRKPGAMMLIAHGGAYEGLISGGCLEGDLLHHAAAVFASGEPSLVTYDMHADEELVWNLGLGCDGIIHLLLQRLDRERDFDFMSQLEVCHGARRPALLALVTQSDGVLPLGAFGLADCSDISVGEAQLRSLLDDLCEPWRDLGRDLERHEWPSWRCQNVRIGTDLQATALVVNIPPRTRVLICGAGPDAVPMARAFAALDWDVLVADHRPAFARAERFPHGCTVLRSRPEQLAQALDPASLDAAVIMSHHLENDAAWLAAVAPHGLRYVGVLGPRARRDRLREMAACGERPLFGPVGLDIGAELPASIALSVAAEIHAVLNRRDGQSLTRRADDEAGQRPGFQMSGREDD
jgi:xanthine/CO dehydrogenase XdhC/CoxF family maturation factor